MASYFGKALHLQLFGESHGPAIGMVLDGLPAGERVDEAALARLMARRAPGSGRHVSQRRETDRVRFLSGLKEGRTSGGPIAAWIENEDRRSQDYEALAEIYRPSHADFTARAKWGEAADLVGGGHFSGRLTAPLTVAGGIAMQCLARRGIRIGACLRRLGPVVGPGFARTELEPAELLADRGPIPFLTKAAREQGARALEAARAEGDALGGEIEVAVLGLPAGLGAPIFEGLENRLAQAYFAMPGLRGIAFGDGFEAAGMRASEHNDPYGRVDGEIRPLTNHAGGVLGGLSTGLPLLIRLAMKPTPSIARPQATVHRQSGEPRTLSVGGRHDPAIVLRAVPVAEAIAALVLFDQWLLERNPYELGSTT